MDAELVAIGRVRRAVKDLPTPMAQFRVLQYVVEALAEARGIAVMGEASEAAGDVTPSPRPRMSEATN